MQNVKTHNAMKVAVSSLDEDFLEIARRAETIPDATIKMFEADLEAKGIPHKHLVEGLKFLMLKAFTRDFKALLLSPEHEVDDVWHVMMLRPVEYAQVCMILAGAVIGHNPRSEISRPARITVTAQLYEMFFGGSPRDNIVSRDALHVAKRKRDATEDDAKMCVYIFDKKHRKTRAVSVTRNGTLGDLVGAAEEIFGDRSRFRLYMDDRCITERVPRSSDDEDSASSEGMCNEQDVLKDIGVTPDVCLVCEYKLMTRGC